MSGYFAAHAPLTQLWRSKSKRNYCCPLEYQGLLARVRCSPGGGSVSVVSSGSAVMLSRSRELVVDGGGRVFVDCEFHMHNLSMFDNPIVWEKRQLSAAGARASGPSSTYRASCRSTTWSRPGLRRLRLAGIIFTGPALARMVQASCRSRSPPRATSPHRLRCRRHRSVVFAGWRRGIALEPFATTRRYDIVLLEQPPRYRLRLKIKGPVLRPCVV